VYGKVIFSNAKGARIQLMFSHDGIVGYVPQDQSPIPAPWMPQHHIRRQNQQGGRQQHARPQQGQRQRRAHSQAPEPTAEQVEQAEPQEAAATATGSREQQQAGPRSVPAAPAINAQLPVGHCRAFKVRSVPREGAAPGPKGPQGPLLSALDIDGDLLLVRMQQLKDFGDQERASFRARVVGANDSGLLLDLASFGAAFMPWRFLCARPPPHAARNDRGYLQWDAQLAQQQLVGRVLQVAIVEVHAAERKVIVSEALARDRRLQRVLQLGNVVEGRVHTVLDRQVFVHLDCLPNNVHALLRSDRVTQAGQPGSLKDFFAPGDRVVGLLSHVDADAKGPRVQMSTMELEGEAGDMLISAQHRERCYASVARHIVR